MEVQMIVEETRRLCREGWEIKIRAARAVEESRMLRDQITDELRAIRKILEKMKAEERPKN